LVAFAREELVANPPSLDAADSVAGHGKLDPPMKFLKKIVSSRSVYVAATIGAAVASSGAGLKWR
jgi:hypothetical protein